MKYAKHPIYFAPLPQHLWPIEQRAMPSTEHSANNLSPREMEVLGLLGKGYRSAHIATLLQISPKTVSAHCTSIRYKLRIADINRLIHYAIAQQKS